MQFPLVELFQSALADVVGAAIVVGVARLFDAFGVAVVDAPHVTEHVRCQLGVRVLAEQPCPHLDPRKAIALRDEAGDFFVGQAGANRDGFKPFGFRAQFFESSAVQC